jgi:hypothetical protein
MFKVEGNEVTFSPTAGEEGIQNAELIDSLGGALCKTLIESQMGDPERGAVAELTTKYDQIFTARTDLWTGMMSATRGGRRFTDAELDFYQGKVIEAEAAMHDKAVDSSAESVLRAQAASDHKTLAEHGLLFDDQMVGVVDRLAANLTDSKPTLLVGDKGIAKTQAAKFVASMWDSSREPVIISGHGDMMSNELVGQMEQDKDTRVFAFKEGKLIQAMREGRPVIIDEVNIGDQPVVMRLQDILLKRPGQTVMLQENGGNVIEIQPGFVVFATANEASSRYQHRNVLDPAFRDRYDVVQVRYPDSDTQNAVTNIPRSLMRLALAAAVDEQGVLSSHIDATQLERFVRLAHVTQHLYSVPARNARVGGLNVGSTTATSAFLDDEPVMTDCITPRTVAEIVERCAAGNKPGMSLEGEIQRSIVGLDQAGSKHNKTYADNALNLLRR